MSLLRSLDSLELEDVAPDEELPDYESANAPLYDSQGYDAPLYTYRLRQSDRKSQIFVPSGYGPRYHVSSRGSFSMFSKKPDMEISRTLQDKIASISFVNEGPLPWRPRACFSHTGTGGMRTHAMESRNFSDWTVVLGETTFVWQLEDQPVSIVLSEKSASLVIARFTYSGCGTRATNGAEVGELTIYRDGLSMETEGIEMILCTLLVAIVHFKKMGRHYWNNVSTRAVPLTREHMSSRRPSIASSAMM